MVEHSEIPFCVDHLLLLLVVASVADLKIVKSLTQYHPLHFTFFFTCCCYKCLNFPDIFWFLNTKSLRSLLEGMPLKVASSAVH